MFSWFTRTARRDTILTEDERQTSLYIIGQPGVGKSRLIESLILQDLEANRGVGVVDVAGDLHNRILAYLAGHKEKWDKVILIEPTQRQYVMRLNPLAPLPGMPSERVAQLITDLVIAIYKLDPTQTPRMVDVMSYAFLAMSALGLSLDDLTNFLLIKKYRDERLAGVPPELMFVQDYFQFEYPKTIGGARLWSLPVLNKINRLLFDPDVRLMMTAGPTLDFRRVIDQGYTVLAYIPKGVLGKATANLLASFIVSRFQQAAMGRTDTSPDTPEARPPFYLYLDEFQNYTTDNITDILDEARKYYLRVTMAHQYIDQLTPEVCSSVLNTSSTIACMRVGYNDAKDLAPYVFPSQSYITHIDTTYRVQGSSRLRTISAEDRREDLGWDGLGSVLANLPARALWLRRKGDSEPLQLRTQDTADIHFTPQTQNQINQLRERSGEQFGYPRAVAMAEMLAKEQAYRASRAAEKTAKKKQQPAEPKRGRGRPKKAPSVANNGATSPKA